MFNYCELRGKDSCAQPVKAPSGREAQRSQSPQRRRAGVRQGAPVSAQKEGGLSRVSW